MAAGCGSSVDMHVRLKVALDPVLPCDRLALAGVEEVGLDRREPGLRITPLLRAEEIHGLGIGEVLAEPTAAGEDVDRQECLLVLVGWGVPGEVLGPEGLDGVEEMEGGLVRAEGLGGGGVEVEAAATLASVFLEGGLEADRAEVEAGQVAALAESSTRGQTPGTRFGERGEEGLGEIEDGTPIDLRRQILAAARDH